jgi:hypothetical protein
MLNAFASNTQAGETKPHQQNRLAQIGENEMSSTENEAVIETVNHYLAGLQNADTAKEHLEQAFYSSTNLHTLDGEGNLQFMPRDALVAYASSGELPSHEGKILSVEVTNDMAFAKVHLNMPDRHFYDYLTLLKINSGWRIVSKTFTTVMK